MLSHCRLIERLSDNRFDNRLQPLLIFVAELPQRFPDNRFLSGKHNGLDGRGLE